MEYIRYCKFDPKDFDKFIELTNEAAEKRKKNPEKYVVPISKSYSMGGGNDGFVLVQAESEEQLINSTAHFYPFVIFEYVPIIEASKIIAAIRERTKK